jgi:hypothetical protein
MRLQRTQLPPDSHGLGIDEADRGAVLDPAGPERTREPHHELDT